LYKNCKGKVIFEAIGPTSPKVCFPIISPIIFATEKFLKVGEPGVRTAGDWPAKPRSISLDIFCSVANCVFVKTSFNLSFLSETSFLNVTGRMVSKPVKGSC
jgi:hypothetical protein